uniref:Uncharacterized protein n=1 Tax=Timema genevievae TaxID=629358 RepID=A0A7R9K6S9_TIMGE|nr:unnamed protein product [Timema genevievae]
MVYFHPVIVPHNLELPLPLQCSCDVVAYQRWPSQMQSEHFPPGDDSVTQMSLDLVSLDRKTCIIRASSVIGFMISGLCGISIYWSRNTNVTIAVIATFLAASSVCGKALISVVVDLFPTSLRTGVHNPMPAGAVSLFRQKSKEVNPHLRGGRVENHLGKPPPVHPTEIRTSIPPSSVVELNTTSALVGGALCFMIPKNFGKNSD